MSRNGTLYTQTATIAGKVKSQAKDAKRMAHGGAIQITGKWRTVNFGRFHEWEMIDGTWRRCGGPGFCRLCIVAEDIERVERAALRKRLLEKAAAKRAARMGE